MSDSHETRRLRPAACARLLALGAVLAVAAGIAAAPAGAARSMLLGIYDESQVLTQPDETFPLLQELRTQAIRVALRWGGPIGVARNGRPAAATDPADPAYDWAIYDSTVRRAAAAKIKVVFSFIDTPGWANGGRQVNRAPTKAADLRNFAYAAARRYSGTYTPPGETEPLPAVRHWLAWNEPSNPLFLWPQYVKKGTGKKRRWVAQSPIDYAKICTAVFTGVHLTTLAGEKVACGATAPRGNNSPTSSRPSIGPIPFLKAVRKAGLKRFDAWAHHPYPSSPRETPTSKPKTNRGKRGLIAPPVILGNINDLVKEVTRLYGRKRIWLTEYGYQTSPPDRRFGVSYAKQASYLRQAVRIARKHPRIDMMLWFLLRDEAKLAGWQSGLVTTKMKKKPAFAVFRALRG